MLPRRSTIRVKRSRQGRAPTIHDYDLFAEALDDVERVHLFLSLACEEAGYARDEVERHHILTDTATAALKPARSKFQRFKAALRSCLPTSRD